MEFVEDTMEGPKNLLPEYDYSTAEGLREETKINNLKVLPGRLGGDVRPAKSSFAVFFLSGALRQEKLELSAQVKRLHATVDHLQGSLNQAHEEVTL